MHPARRALGVVWSNLWIVGALVLGFFLWPSSLGGCTTLTIVSGESMEPTYYTGDLVVARCGATEVGDVVVYSPPDIPGARIIHRVVGGTAADGWVIQGDNNDFLDPWKPTDEHVHGHAVLHVPGAGRVAALLLSPIAWASVLLVALAMVVWPGRTEPTGPDDDADDAHPDAGDGTHDDGTDDDLTGGGPASWPPDPADPAPADPRGDLLDRLGVVRAAVVARAGRLTAGRPRGRRLALRALVAAFVAVPLATGAGVANAAQLGVEGASLTVLGAADRCSTAVVAARPGPVTAGRATTVLLTVPQACAGAAGRLRLAGVTGTDLTFTAQAGTTTVTVPGGYTAAGVTGVALTFDTWGMRTSWTYTPPVTAGPAVRCWTNDPARPCEATVTIGNAWAAGYDVTVVVRDTRTVTANNPVPWTVELDFRNAAYPWVPTGLDSSGVVAASTCADLPVLRLTGTTTWGEHHQLRRGETRSVWLQARRDGTGTTLRCG